jgi:hypothetical protein
VIRNGSVKTARQLISGLFHPLIENALQGFADLFQSFPCGTNALSEFRIARDGRGIRKLLERLLGVLQTSQGPFERQTVFLHKASGR